MCQKEHGEGIYHHHVHQNIHRREFTLSSFSFRSPYHIHTTSPYTMYIKSNLCTSNPGFLSLISFITYSRCLAWVHVRNLPSVVTIVY